jgi:cysteine desulfurase / selenocysteine lyase
MTEAPPATPPSTPLWQRVRRDFPVTANLIYLNHAAVAPLPAPVAQAMIDFSAQARDYGSLHYGRWLQTYENCRLHAARLIGAHRDEIAIVKNTSEGISIVANGLGWRTGDRVVAFREEFPSNYYPWLRLAEKGVEVIWLNVEDPLEKIEAACRGARLLAISFVNYLTGFRADLAAIGEVCHRHGTFFFVDAIQGLGAYPLDVERCHIDALAADGHKWLLGPEGCGILYVRRDRLDQIEPVEFGWTNSVSFSDYASRDMTPRPDAARYECGTLTSVAIYGLEAALRYVLAIGIDHIEPAVETLAGQLAARALAKGYRLATDRRAGTTSGIVSFQKDGVDSRLIVSRLKEAGILAAPRQGWVRASPHYYLAGEEMDRAIAQL